MPYETSSHGGPTSSAPMGLRKGPESSGDTRVDILLADFAARWQELLNFETEVSRWFTLYVTAVIAVIGWAMGNIPAIGIQALLKQHDGLNTVFVLTLALLNPVYILALAFNGYRIQQIGQYLYSHVGIRLSILTNEPFDVWEDWRRSFLKTPGTYGPELIRRAYYTSIAVVPAFVSGLLLVTYWWFEGKTQTRWSGHNCFAYGVVVVNITVALLSLRTSAQNQQWNSLINRRRHEENMQGVTRRPFFENAEVVDRQPPPSHRPATEALSITEPAPAAHADSTERVPTSPNLGEKGVE